MEYTVYPYSVTSDGWWTGVDIYNHSPYPTSIAIDIQRVNGTISKRIEKQISPLSHIIIDNAEISQNLNDDSGRCTLFVEHAETSFISVFIGKSDFFQVLSGISCEKISNQTGMRTIKNCYAYEFCGKNECKYLTANTFKSFDMLLKMLYFENTDKTNSKIVLGDACPISGNCLGHPGASHSCEGLAIDINYITTCNTNYTQYRPPETEKLIIWDGDNLINFDHGRNLQLITWILDTFPSALIRIDEIIYNELGINFAGVVDDQHGQYNHDTHMHVDFK